MEPDDAPLGEIELISDEHGVAVIGDPAAVELFLASEGLKSKELGLPRLSKAATPVVRSPRVVRRSPPTPVGG